MTANDGDADGARVLRPLQVAACTYLIAFGLRAGQKLMTAQGAIPGDADFNQKLGADMRSFVPQPAVRCGADHRQALERLRRNITRQALPKARAQTDAAGQVVLKLQTAWREGTAH